MAGKPPAPATPTTPTVQLPVYEQSLGYIRFVFESALDKGGVLLASDIPSNQLQSSEQKNLNIDNPGAKFIKVTVGAQNNGTINIQQGSWNIENIVDSQGRNFVPLTGYSVQPWISNPDLCGTLLKPAFDPTPCTKIYEVSKASTGLKIRVETGKDNDANNFSSGKIQSALIDLIVK